MNVLKKYQRKGIATALMEEAEKRIFYKSNLCGFKVVVDDDLTIALLKAKKEN